MSGKRKFLIAPCRPVFNEALMVQVETRRLQMDTFSNAHWIMQLLIEYQNLFNGDHKGTGLSPWGAMAAAAIEDIFKTLMREGDKAAIARAQALKDDGFTILTWFPVRDMSDEEWIKLRNSILSDGRYHYTVEGD